MNRSHFFNLINVANINSGLLTKNFVNSRKAFLEFPINLKGLPILISAQEEILEFSSSDIFELTDHEILSKVYNLVDPDYVGYRHAFKSKKFLSKFKVKKGFQGIVQKIVFQNYSVLEELVRIKERNKLVGAFQTRNIPHFGHEKIIERMLELCDHVVINPVIGPKKTGDVTESLLLETYSYLSKTKYNKMISFKPIVANMFYAGPNEALHHTILRQRIGFDYFTVGRDHAGSDNAYKPEMAIELIKSNINKLNIKILTHLGSVFCSQCCEVIIVGDCSHSIENFKDISGSDFRANLRERKIFRFADREMQHLLFKNGGEIFEK